VFALDEKMMIPQRLLMTKIRKYILNIREKEKFFKKKKNLNK